MVSCSVLHCNNRTERKEGDIRFHRFPIDIHNRNKWIQAVGRSDWFPTKNARICSLHFEEEHCIIAGNKVHLAKNAVPTLNVPKILTEPPQVQYAKGETMQTIATRAVTLCQIQEENVLNTKVLFEVEDTERSNFTSKASNEKLCKIGRKNTVSVGNSSNNQELSQPSQLVTSSEDENIYLLTDPIHIKIEADDHMVTKQESQLPTLKYKCYEEECIKKDEIINAMSLEISTLKVLLRKSESKLESMQNVDERRLKTIARLRKRYKRGKEKTTKLKKVVSILCEDQDVNQANLAEVRSDRYDS